MSGASATQLELETLARRLQVKDAGNPSSSLVAISFGSFWLPTLRNPQRRNIVFKYLLNSSLVVALATFAVGCDIDQTREGELPTVDVDVSGDPGQMPAYDVDGPEVDVKMKDKQVTVPDVDVEMKEETIRVPDVDVTLPRDE